MEFLSNIVQIVRFGINVIIKMEKKKENPIHIMKVVRFGINVILKMTKQNGKRKTIHIMKMEK